MKSNRSQKEIVLTHLANGNTLTAAAAKKQFRIGNPYEVIRRLREDGNPIYLNVRNGQYFYRLGKPKKNAVAKLFENAGARAFR